MVYFNLSYRFSSVFSMSIPLFSKSENAHFRTLSPPDFFLTKYPEHYSPCIKHNLTKIPKTSFNKKAY